jgi:hypothetical protein
VHGAPTTAGGKDALAKLRIRGIAHLSPCGHRSVAGEGCGCGTHAEARCRLGHACSTNAPSPRAGFARAFAVASHRLSPPANEKSPGAVARERAAAGIQAQFLRMRGSYLTRVTRVKLFSLAVTTSPPLPGRA